jgi:hypothetical protein
MSSGKGLTLRKKKEKEPKARIELAHTEYWGMWRTIVPLPNVSAY